MNPSSFLSEADELQFYRNLLSQQSQALSSSSPSVFVSVSNPPTQVPECAAPECDAVDLGFVNKRELYIVNRKSEYYVGINTASSVASDGTFLALQFNFEHSTTGTNKWLGKGPAAHVQELALLKSDVTKPELYNQALSRLPEYFKSYANELFKRLGDLYPYEATNDTCLTAATVFCSSFCKLEEYLTDYRTNYGTRENSDLPPEPKKRKNNKISDYPDSINLIKAKLKSKFKSRGRTLKNSNLWPVSDTRVKMNEAATERFLQNFKFDYRSAKVAIERLKQQKVLARSANSNRSTSQDTEDFNDYTTEEEED